MTAAAAADDNGPFPTTLERFMAEIRVRITSDDGVLPYRFLVQGIPMSEGTFRVFCNSAGVRLEDVVREIRKRK